MMSSGPLLPSDYIPPTTCPTEVVVPLEFVERQSKAAREDLDIDESGLYMMSKAVEEFMRQIMREATDNGTKILDYDAIAKCIQASEFKILKDFFPTRVRFGDIVDEIASDPSGPTSSTSL